MDMMKFHPLVEKTVYLYETFLLFIDCGIKAHWERGSAPVPALFKKKTGSPEMLFRH